MKPMIAVVGRPNVGKSTFFNRVIGRKEALVDNVPGVTRDRHHGDAVWNDIPFTLIDTGGFLTSDTDEFAPLIREQVSHALQSADAIILLLDGKSGRSPFDDELIALLRRENKPIFFAVNKIDGPSMEHLLADFFQLGIDDLYAVSAEHGYGVPDLLDDLVKLFAASMAEEPVDLIRVAVAGRPNVGKSSLINRLLGEERMVVSPVPGTTRDAVDTELIKDGQSYLLIDTAGIRRKAKVHQKIEKFSIIKTLKRLERCDVALIMIDAADGITEQDIRIAGYAFERKCGTIFLLNKWDLVDKKERPLKWFQEQLKEAAKFMGFAPMLTLSAKTGARVNKLFPLIQGVYQQYTTRTGTGPLNKIIEEAIFRNEPPLHNGRRLKFYYATQVATKPPAIVCFVNYAHAVHFSYERYLINQIRSATGLTQTPLSLMFRQRTGRLTETFKARDEKARRKGRQSKKGK